MFPLSRLRGRQFALLSLQRFILVNCLYRPISWMSGFPCAADRRIQFYFGIILIFFLVIRNQSVTPNKANCPSRTRSYPRLLCFRDGVEVRFKRNGSFDNFERWFSARRSWWTNCWNCGEIFRWFRVPIKASSKSSNRTCCHCACDHHCWSTRRNYLAWKFWHWKKKRRM